MKKIILMMIICLSILSSCKSNNFKPQISSSSSEPMFEEATTSSTNANTAINAVTDTLSSDIYVNIVSPLPLYKSYLQRSNIESMLNENPIDESFLENEMPSEAAEIVKYYSEYIDYWKKEMDNALLILKDNLQPESYKVLESSQNNWLEYISEDLATANQIHIESVGVGSEIPILAANKDMLQMRERTLELAEYCIMISGSYDFIFSN